MPRRSVPPLLAFVLAISTLLAERASAQSLFGVHRLGPAPRLTEFTGPPSGACDYPDGPVLRAFTGSFGCPNPLPVGVGGATAKRAAGGAVGSPGSLAGSPPTSALLPFPPGPFDLFIPLFPRHPSDVAFDPVTDTVWVSNGFRLSRFDLDGTRLATFRQAVIGLITGLGFDGASGLLWMTDGVEIAAISPPTNGTCGVTSAAVGPFSFAGSGFLTDLDWEPQTGSLWVCNATGQVKNVFPDGSPGPYPEFDVCAAACTLSLPLTGLAVDRTTPSFDGDPLALYVTDGDTIARLGVDGSCAAPTLPSPECCAPTPTSAPLTGLTQTSHGIRFGTGVAGTGPSIGCIEGNSILGDELVVTLDGAPPHAQANLFYSLTQIHGCAYCPPVSPFICYCGGPQTPLLGTGITNADGELTLEVPITTDLLIGGLPGLEMCIQWEGPGAQPPGSQFVSQGLWVTIALP